MKTAYTLYVILWCFLLGGCQTDEAGEHYREGLRLSGQHRTAEAMRAFRLASEGGGDQDVAARATAELGRLCMNQHELGQAHDYLEKALSMSDELALADVQVLTRRDLGRLARVEGHDNDALRWFAGADSLIVVSGADSLREQVYPEYLSLLVGVGQRDNARRLMHGWAVDHRSGPSCLVAGKFYRLLGMSDSAAYYLERCMETDHVSARASAAMYLAEMAIDGEDAEQAYAYAMECAVLVDSAKHVMQHENANLVAQLSDQIAVERENSRLQVWLGVAVALLVGLVVAMVFYVRWRMERLRRRQEAEQQERRQQARSRQDELAELFRNTRLYRHILSDETITEAQWDEIEAFLDAHADHFTQALQAFYPKIKPQEMQVCQLVKLEFTNQQIAVILCKTQQAITNLRKRLYQKMFDREGSAEELSQFVRLFPEK